jgi:hypothetical protein
MFGYGWSSNRGGRWRWGGGFGFFILPLFLIGMFFAFGFFVRLLPWIVLIALAYFAVRWVLHSRGGRSRLAGDAADGLAGEKRKRHFERIEDAEVLDADGKPKRESAPPRYYIGDDGELIEAPPHDRDDRRSGRYV